MSLFSKKKEEKKEEKPEGTKTKSTGAPKKNAGKAAATKVAQPDKKPILPEKKHKKILRILEKYPDATIPGYVPESVYNELRDKYNGVLGETKDLSVKLGVATPPKEAAKLKRQNRILTSRSKTLNKIMKGEHPDYIEQATYDKLYEDYQRLLNEQPVDEDGLRIENPRAIFNALKTAYASLEETNKSLEESIGELGDTNKQYQEEIDCLRAAAQKDSDGNPIVNWSEYSARMESTLEKSNNKYKELKAQYEQTDNELKNLKEKTEAQRTFMRKATEAQLTHSDTQLELEAQKVETAELQSRVEILEQERKSYGILEAQYEQLQDQVKILEEARNNLKSEFDGLLKERDTLQTKLGEAKEALAQAYSRSK